MSTIFGHFGPSCTTEPSVSVNASERLSTAGQQKTVSIVQRTRLYRCWSCGVDIPLNLNKAKRGLLEAASVVRRPWDFSFFIKCLSVTRMSGAPGCTGPKGDDVSTTSGGARPSFPHVRGTGGGRTVCPFSAGSVFDASLLHEIARILGARLGD